MVFVVHYTCTDDGLICNLSLKLFSNHPINLISTVMVPWSFSMDIETELNRKKNCQPFPVVYD